jgi:hypothetical protein
MFDYQASSNLRLVDFDFDSRTSLEKHDLSQWSCEVRCGTADVNLKLIGRRWLIGVQSFFGQVAEWLKAAARKGCYATQVVSEVRILPLSAKSLG